MKHKVKRPKPKNGVKKIKPRHPAGRKAAVKLIEPSCLLAPE